MSIQGRLQDLNTTLPSDVELLSVTKYASLETIQTLYNLGLRRFAESKIQDAEDKIKVLGYQDVSWELIGHLQRNKAKKAVTLFDRIQSVDSLRLLQKINDEAQKIAKKQKILFQLNLAKEPQKHGFLEADFLENEELLFSFDHVEVQGIMTMAKQDLNDDDCQLFFRSCKNFYDILKERHPSISVLSMGMSQDYEIAVKEGSNLVRLGSLIIND